MKTLKPEEYTKANLLRHLLRQDINLTCPDAGRLYNDATYFSSSQFCTIKREIIQEQKQLKLFEKQEAKKEKTEKAEKAEKAKTTEKTETETKYDVKINASITALQLENSYLRWQLEGERQGFFDKWLEEHEDVKA